MNEEYSGRQAIWPNGGAGHLDDVSHHRPQMPWIQLCCVAGASITSLGGSGVRRVMDLATPLPRRWPLWPCGIIWGDLGLVWVGNTLLL